MPAMQCPACGKPLEAGKVELHSTISGFLMWGESSEHLWWYDKEDQRDQLIESGGGKLAYRCLQCGTVVLPSQRVLEDLRGQRAADVPPGWVPDRSSEQASEQASELASEQERDPRPDDAPSHAPSHVPNRNPEP
jgi:hypothetical protein